MMYDRQGRRISIKQFCDLLRHDPGYRRVARTDLDDVRVSTVWLGVDHGLRGPPLIFETMIFPECYYCRRTPTEEAALAAHDQAVQHVRSGDYAATSGTGR